MHEQWLFWTRSCITRARHSHREYFIFPNTAEYVTKRDISRAFFGTRSKTVRILRTLGKAHSAHSTPYLYVKPTSNNVSQHFCTTFYHRRRWSISSGILARLNFMLIWRIVCVCVWHDEPTENLNTICDLMFSVRSTFVSRCVMCVNVHRLHWFYEIKVACHSILLHSVDAFVEPWSTRRKVESS